MTFLLHGDLLISVQKMTVRILSKDCLWLVGSHGLKRKSVKPARDAGANTKRLAKVTLDGNRRLLACLPIETDSEGAPALVRQGKDGRRALRLKGDSQSNELTRALSDDPHFGRFLQVVRERLQSGPIRRPTATESRRFAEDFVAADA